MGTFLTFPLSLFLGTNLSDKNFKTGGKFSYNDERAGLPFGIIEGEIILARNPWVSDFIFIFLFYVLGMFLTFPLSLFLGTDFGDFETAE